MQKLLKKFEIDKLIKYGIAAILIAVPLYPKFPFLKVPGIYVSIRIEDFLILVVTILWAIKIFPHLKTIWKNKIVKAAVLFLVVSLIATLSGIIFLRTTPVLVGILEWGRRVEYLMGFFIALTFPPFYYRKTGEPPEKLIQFYAKCVGLVLIIIFIYGVGQRYFSWPVITTQNGEYSKGIALRYVAGGHLASTFAGHYDLATYVILTSPIFIAIFFMKRELFQQMLRIDYKLARGLILFIIFTSFWLMVNAASRISAVSYVLSVSITLFLIRKYKYIPVVIITTTVFAFSTSNLFNRYLNIFDVIKRKLMGLIPTAYAEGNLPVALPPAAPVFEDRSTSIRLAVEWPRSIRAFLKNPLLGTGYGSTTLATDNDYLRALGETGILGAIATFMMFFGVIREFLVKSWPTGVSKPLGIFSKKEIDFRTAFLAGIIGAIPGLFLNAFFIDIFEASKFAISFWILIGLGIAILYEKNY
jgi:O-antigen ligase